MNCQSTQQPLINSDYAAHTMAASFRRKDPRHAACDFFVSSIRSVSRSLLFIIDPACRTNRSWFRTLQFVRIFTL